MKIAEYEVTNITQTSAKVGCTTVTLKEAEELVKAMKTKKVFVSGGYEGYTVKEAGYIRFTLQGDDNSLFGFFSNNSQHLGLRLSLDYAKQLHDFLEKYI